MRSLRLALAQINTTVGDFEGNFQKIVHYSKLAVKKKVDIIAFPELTMTGYPPEDLLLKQKFVKDNLFYLNKLLPFSKNIAIVVGFVDKKDDIFNSAAILHNGELVHIYHKHFLPNYGVFDEDRYFQKGTEVTTISLNDVNIGINICEDIWYPFGPARDQALYGNAEIIINISASPYSIGKGHERLRMMAQRSVDNIVIVAHVNLIGAQDELVFDGNSMIVSETGKLIAKAPAFREDLIILDLYPDNVLTNRLRDPRRRKEKFYIAKDKILNQITLSQTQSFKKKSPIKYQSANFPGQTEEIYEALKLGLKDYVEKNRFKKVVLGLSGGIDSALVCTIAVDVLGSKNVIGVSMPSQYTNRKSKEDAKNLSQNVKIKFYEIPINNLLKIYLNELQPYFYKSSPDTTEENIQARIRGNIVMALSNKFGWLVLATGNKSEISVGYCTLYGDMAGGFSVIKDVPKELVYELCNYRNKIAKKELIPESILKKAPSAELKDNQKDTDSLPPYNILDPILKDYVEQNKSYDEIVNLGFEPEVVKKIIKLVDGNEYKRRQGAPGIKITHRAFGKDWRFPITNRYGKDN